LRVVWRATVLALELAWLRLRVAAALLAAALRRSLAALLVVELRELLEPVELVEPRRSLAGLLPVELPGVAADGCREVLGWGLMNLFENLRAGLPVYRFG
jgi:hypothetical protein